MKCECHFGGFTHWVANAGSPLQAAIETFRECLEQWHTYARQPFIVIDLETGQHYRVKLSTVIKCLALAADYDPDLPEPALDPDCDIMRFARLKSPDCRKRELSLSK